MIWRIALFTLALTLPIGCSLAPSDSVAEKFMNSDRSWCVSVTTIYGTLRMGGTGADGASVLCNQEGLRVDKPAGTGGVPVEVAPVKLRMIPQ